MESGSTILRSSSSVDHQSVPNSKYQQQQQQQQKMRSESTRNTSKNHHQIRRHNSMLLDQKTMMMMMRRMEHQYQYPPHPQYNQYHGGRGGGGTGGIFLNPPISLATSPSFPPIRQRVASHHNNNNQQPPLLPLPVQYFQSPIPPPPKRTQSLSPAKSNKPAVKVDENGTTAASPKKPSSKKQQSKNNSNYKTIDSSSSKTIRLPKTRSDDSLVNLNPSGPEPESLPKDVSKVLLPVVAGGGRGGGVGIKKVSFSSDSSGSSIFSLAPPPSSLPLPKFSILRPKIMSCNAQAGSVTAGGGSLNVVDTTGPTDILCRLLNLR